MASGSFLKEILKMLTEQRYQIILDLLKEKKSVTATELKEILDTSESTVRRDITALHKAGKLIKVFGGAVALEDEGTVSAYEPTVEQKSELYVKEKKKNRSICGRTDRGGRLYLSRCRNNDRLYD